MEVGGQVTTFNNSETLFLNHYMYIYVYSRYMNSCAVWQAKKWGNATVFSLQIISFLSLKKKKQTLKGPEESRSRFTGRDRLSWVKKERKRHKKEYLLVLFLATLGQAVHRLNIRWSQLKDLSSGPNWDKFKMTALNRSTESCGLGRHEILKTQLF